MPTTISGTTGVSQVQDGAISTPEKLGSAVVTPPKMSGGQTGNPPVFGARAWAKFNGGTTGTNAPTAGGNVATIQRVGAGIYAVVFTTAMPDANYAVSGTASTTSTAESRGGVVHPVDGTLTTTGFTFIVSRNGDNGAAPALQDNANVSFSVYR